MINKSMNNNCRSEGFGMQRSEDDLSGYRLNQQDFFLSHHMYSHNHQICWHIQQKNRYSQQMCGHSQQTNGHSEQKEYMVNKVELVQLIKGD